MLFIRRALHGVIFLPWWVRRRPGSAPGAPGKKGKNFSVASLWKNCNRFGFIARSNCPYIYSRFFFYNFVMIFDFSCGKKQKINIRVY